MPKKATLRCIIRDTYAALDPVRGKWKSETTMTAVQLRTGKAGTIGQHPSQRLPGAVDTMRERQFRAFVSTDSEPNDLVANSLIAKIDPRRRWTESSLAPRRSASSNSNSTTNVTKLNGATGPEKSLESLTSVELFAGAGGLALGCQKAGFRSLAMVEWNRWACDTIRENKAASHELVKDWNVFQGDVRDFHWSTINEDVALVSGGPPCQPFSGGGRGRSVDDERDMFPSTAEVITELHPQAFLLENVRGLTRDRFADYYEYVLRRLETPEIKARAAESWFEHLERLRRLKTTQSLHYDVYPTLLNAADFGVPQQRHRVFIVGFRSDLGVQWSFPEPKFSQDALIKAQWITGEYWDDHRIAKSQRPERPSTAALARASSIDHDVERWRTLRDALKGLPDPLEAAPRGIRNHEFQPGARTYVGHTGSPLDTPSKTLKAGSHGVPGGENMIRFADGSVRYLTVRESARVQTFPDDYELHGAWGEAMRQLGNAVPVELGRVVAAGVHEALNSVRSKGVRK